MIISKDNETFKYLKKLKEKKYRDLNNQFLVFGDHLIKEAKKAGCVAEIFTSNDNKEGILMSEDLIKELNFTESPSDILAICYKKMIKKSQDKILILEDVQDPDNVGALIRSAAAFNFSKVITSLKTADIFNEKVIRASKGSIFHVEITREDIEKTILDLKTSGYYIVATDVRGSNAKINNSNNKIALVLGNEGKGISSFVSSNADQLLTIKTNNVESLNVAIAGSIIMYEVNK